MAFKMFVMAFHMIFMMVNQAKIKYHCEKFNSSNDIRTNPSKTKVTHLN